MKKKKESCIVEILFQNKKKKTSNTDGCIWATTTKIKQKLLSEIAEFNEKIKANQVTYAQLITHTHIYIRNFFFFLLIRIYDSRYKKNNKWNVMLSNWFINKQQQKNTKPNNEIKNKNVLK